MRREYSNTHEISQHLICTYCKKPFFKTVLTKCNHNFCEQCSIHMILSNKSCFECGCKLTSKDTKPNPFVDRVLSYFNVLCTFSPKCIYVGKLDNIEKHEKNCFYNPENKNNSVSLKNEEYHKIKNEDKLNNHNKDNNEYDEINEHHESQKKLT